MRASGAYHKPTHDPEALILTLERGPVLLIPLVRSVPPERLKQRPKPEKWSAHERDPLEEGAAVPRGGEAHLLRLGRDVGGDHQVAGGARLAPHHGIVGDDVEARREIAGGNGTRGGLRRVRARERRLRKGRERREREEDERVNSHDWGV